MVADARVERIWTGSRWTEGPAWLADRGLLVWSDIPGDRMLSYEPASGRIATFRQPAMSPNGNTVDRQGRLVTCEQTPHRIARTEPDGAITPLVDRIDGRPFNSPNDVAVTRDGVIWFSDPSYGRDRSRADDDGVAGCHVYRFDPASGVVRQMTHDFVMPNGLAFSPDESILYIADTGASHDPENGPRHIRAFKLGADGKTLGASKVFATCTSGLFDGFRLDIEGRIWSSAADGVHVYHPDGTLVGKVAIPEIVANVCWGGPKLNRLFICGTTSLYAVMTHTNGAGRP